MKRRRAAAFTMLDLLLIVVVLFILAGLLLPSVTRCGGRSPRIQCLSNLKQIALAFRMWSNDHGEKFPMQLTAAERGTKELALQGLPLASFLIISNEMNSPKLLFCPADEERKRVTGFSQLTPKNISYFLGVDASEINPQTILVGDRNLKVNGRPVNGLVQIVDPTTATWGPKIHKHAGNMAFADGSAQQVMDFQLQKALQATTLATNRFAVP